MKKLAILFFGFALILSSCQEDKGYYLSGTIDGFEDGKKVYISERDESTRSLKTIDTAVVKDGKFEIDLEEQELPTLSFLGFEGLNGNVVFISENQKINFDINKDSLRNFLVTGGKENKALNEYLSHLKELNRKMVGMQTDMRNAASARDTAQLNSLRNTQQELRDNDKNFKEELFSRNKDSYVSVMLLTDMLNMRSHTSAEVREMYGEISERLKKTPLAKSLKETLDNSLAAEIGSKAPSFTAPTPDGEQLSLEDNLGKVTVVDFWAAWCKPCRIENPNLVKTYNKYKDQGLNIISVSLDRPGQKDRWVKAIEDDNLEQWSHVSNLKFWDEPVARKYRVRSIPATFILDEDGVIVAKNLRGEELTNKIGELLK
ncbi:TlpA disulfide reductase family protein [Christiangramia sabulilitoris]|uniref:AhpC/TSA family protein n=1 Tax=Christiangramia sabulilitoris TaxID=2583991 RepID=A0A550I2F9_9FLAO|nr:TlpA disulfide reductase family protein [Christiangramia sabulilitoris]TRO65131.1 AhpC/TSA family protein [Christiangramia sabulilitoris]